MADETRTPALLAMLGERDPAAPFAALAEAHRALSGIVQRAAVGSGGGDEKLDALLDRSAHDVALVMDALAR